MAFKWGLKTAAMVVSVLLILPANKVAVYNPYRPKR